MTLHVTDMRDVALSSCFWATYLMTGSNLYFQSPSANLMTMALTITMTEPRASPSTCRKTPRMLSLALESTSRRHVLKSSSNRFEMNGTRMGKGLMPRGREGWRMEGGGQERTEKSQKSGRNY